MDLADIREYVHGDDVRHIDWNVTARMDTPYVREYREDREVTAWMLLDRSPSMSFGPEERTKLSSISRSSIEISSVMRMAIFVMAGLVPAIHVFVHDGL